MQGGEEYLTLAEIEKEYGWKPGTVYYFRDKELLQLYSFAGDKRSYCKKAELEAVKDRPPEVRKRGPKSHALSKPIFVGTGRARRRIAVDVSASTAVL